MITDTAPYGTTPGMVKILETYRETGLGGSMITGDLVSRFGFEREVARRIALSFKLLDLTDEEGRPTETLLAFKQAPTTSYKELLASHLYDAYSSVFAITGKNIAGKAPSEIEDAFRHFKPDSLRKRMVSLFLGLCEYTGIVDESPRSKPGRKTGGPANAKPKAPVAKVVSIPRPPKQIPPEPSSDGDSYTVSLKSGGQIKLAVFGVNLFALTTDDRKFVIDLIDAMKAYGDRPALPPGRVEATQN